VFWGGGISLRSHEISQKLKSSLIFGPAVVSDRHRDNFVDNVMTDMSKENVHVSLSEKPLNASEMMDLVRSPEAGAIVLFAGTTRNNFKGTCACDHAKDAGKTVIHLDYEAYPDMALPSLRSICTDAKQKWSLFGVAVTHRLGRVPIGQESILIAVSSAHRKAAWEAAEWILEEVKRKTEIWKKEFYENPDDEPQWKENFPLAG